MGLFLGISVFGALALVYTPVGHFFGPLPHGGCPIIITRLFSRPRHNQYHLSCQETGRLSAATRDPTPFFWYVVR